MISENEQLSKIRVIIKDWYMHKTKRFPNKFSQSVAICLHDELKEILFNFGEECTDQICEARRIWNAVDDTCERRHYRRLDLVGTTIDGWNDFTESEAENVHST